MISIVQRWCQAIYIFPPLSYNVYSAVDSSLITQAVSNSHRGLVAPIVFFADTIIPIYIEIRDAT